MAVINIRLILGHHGFYDGLSHLGAQADLAAKRTIGLLMQNALL
jgi:hypothetical protein